MLSLSKMQCMLGVFQIRIDTPAPVPASARSALSLAWAEVQAVADSLLAYLEQVARCRLAMRETFAALLVIDRVAAEFE
jgi:hypothetical protein